MTTARALIAEATLTPLNKIPDFASITTLDSWDSLSHMRLILVMEEHLGKEMPGEAIVEIATLEDVARYLAEPG